MEHPGIILRGRTQHSDLFWHLKCLTFAVLITLKRVTPSTTWVPRFSETVSYVESRIVPFAEALVETPTHFSGYPAEVWEQLQAKRDAPLVIGFIIRDDDNNEARFMEMFTIELPFPDVPPPPVPNQVSDGVEVQLAEERLMKAARRNAERNERMQEELFRIISRSERLGIIPKRGPSSFPYI